MRVRLPESLAIIAAVSIIGATTMVSVGWEFSFEPLTVAMAFLWGAAGGGAAILNHRRRGEKDLWSIDVPLPRMRVAEPCTTLAAWVAGKRRNVGPSWLDHLRGDPEEGQTPTRSQKAKMVAGFLWSAVRYRIHDAMRPTFVPMDWVLKTRNRRESFVASVVGAHVVYIVWRDGLHTLLTYGWTWTAGSGVAAWALLNWLGKRRGIELASDDAPPEK
ncbi:hypothetical protein ACFQ7G_23480 [Streptomyces massasporeus]